MAPEKEYIGLEKRTGPIDRRELSALHEEMRRIQKAEREEILLLRTIVETKVSMKLFYTTVALIAVILGVQWGTYVEIGKTKETITQSIHLVQLKMDTFQEVSRVERKYIGEKNEGEQERINADLTKLRREVDRLHDEAQRR